MPRPHLCLGRDLPAPLRGLHGRLTAAAFGMALVLLLGGPARSSAPAFASLRSWLPMRGWGLVWAVVALHLLYSSCQRRLVHVQWAALVAGGAFAAFAVAIALSALASPAASFIGSVSFAYAASSAYAVALRAARARSAQR